MPTTTKHPEVSRSKVPARQRSSAGSAKTPNKESRVRLHTSADVRAYLAAHLTPVRFGPKGQPIYAQKDIEKLNVIIRPGV